MADAAKRVLVVDDDPGIRTLVSRIAARLGHEVRTASDGAEGLELSGSWAPHLVITDITMPGVEGLSTIRQLRAQDPSVRILVISGSRFAGQTYVGVARKLGADAGLEKPFTPSDLSAAIEGLLSGSPGP